MKYFKYIIPIFIFFIGFSVNAMGPQSQWLNNNEVVATQDSQTLSVPSFIHSTAIKMRIYGVTSLTASNDYSFRVNFSLRTQGSNPYITQCGLNINNSYVATSSLTFSRTSREIGSSFTDSSFVVTANYTMLSSYGEVPIFIQCDLNDLYLQSNYSATATSGQGSIINSIDQNGQNIISNNNYNTDKQNANRDSNTTRDIENRTSLFNGLQQTLSNILQNLQNKLNDVKTGIGNTINSAVTTISSGLNSIVTAVGNIVSPIVNKLGEISSNIVTVISNGINSVVNKIGELIGTQEVCNLYYETNNSNVIHGDSYEQGYLNNDGSISGVNRNNFTTPFLEIPYNSSAKLSYKYYGNVTYRYCLYNNEKGLIRCTSYNDINIEPDINEVTLNLTNQTSYIRYSGRMNYGSTYSILKGNCQRTGIAGLFNKFTQFVSNFFSNVLGLNRIGSVLDRHKGILENPAFDGITSVLNAPRQLIQSMNSYSCSNITTSVFNHNITLPSGCFFWEREDVTSFRAFWNLLFGGFLIYKFAYRLFKVLNDCLDPTKDDIGGFEV